MMYYVHTPKNVYYITEIYYIETEVNYNVQDRA